VTIGLVPTSFAVSITESVALEMGGNAAAGRTADFPADDWGIARPQNARETASWAWSPAWVFVVPREQVGNLLKLRNRNPRVK
jgi:hypothetical protein